MLKDAAVTSVRDDNQVSSMAAMFQGRGKFSSLRRAYLSEHGQEQAWLNLVPYSRAAGCTCCSGWESRQQNLSIFNFFFFSLRVRLTESHHRSGWRRVCVCIFLTTLYIKFNR